MIKIEKGIPMPENRGGQYAVTKYPWKTMEIGDSFFVPNTTQYAFSGQLISAGRRLGRKFSSRKVDGGVRVWRVE